MKSWVLTLLLLLSDLTEVISTNAPGVHLPLYRRGGTFSQHEPANLTRISQILARTEARFAKTYTDIQSNRIVRRWSDGPHGPDDYLLDGAGLEGSWYTTIQIGTPPQTLEVDIDMLNPDFYTIMTTSGRGSKYDTFASNSHEPTRDQIHPTCLKTTDILHLPVLDSSNSLDTNSNPKIQSLPLRTPFPICQPPKYTHNTLHSSGSILGLAPSTSNPDSNSNDNNNQNTSPLSRLNSPSLLSHLLSTTTIIHPLIHVTLLTPKTGLLTLGNPPTYHLELQKTTLEHQLSRLSSPDPSSTTTTLTQDIAAAMNFLVPPDSHPDSWFTWTDAGRGGVRGWHGGLVHFWVDGVKVLRNQMVVFDVNCGVVLGPKGIARVLFDGGAGRSVAGLWGGVLGHDEDENENEHEARGGNGDQNEQQKHKFWAYPCLNPPNVEVEIGGWRFPLTSPDGFGLGRVNMNDKGSENDRDEDKNKESDDEEEEEIGTGYCVSAIVETDMGRRPRWSGSGMADVWVLGEPFFRAVGVVFEVGGEGGRVGVRKYLRF